MPKEKKRPARKARTITPTKLSPKKVKSKKDNEIKVKSKKMDPGIDISEDSKQTSEDTTMELTSAMEVTPITPSETEPNVHTREDPYDLSMITQLKDLDEVDKNVLLTFLYFNSAGSNIEDHATLASTNIQYLQEQSWLTLQYQRSHKDEMFSIQETLNYIPMSNMEEDESESIPFLQMHARNWLEHKGENIQECTTGDCKDVLVNILEDAREELPKFKPFIMDLETESMIKKSNIEMHPHSNQLNQDDDQTMEDCSNLNTLVPNTDIRYFPHDVTQKSLKGVSTMDLAKYVHQRKLLFKESSNLHNLQKLKRKSLIGHVQKYAALIDPTITETDTIQFLLNNDNDAMSHFPSKDLQQHLLNYQDSPMNVHILEPELILQELQHAREEVLTRSNPSKANASNAIDFAKANDALNMTKITTQLEDKDIDALQYREATQSLRQYLIQIDQLELLNSIGNLTLEDLHAKIRTIRDVLIEKSKALTPILEDKDQTDIELLPDVPAITKELNDEDLKNFSLESLAKIYFKHIKREGNVTHKLSNFLLWSEESLRRNIRKKRDLLSKPKSVLKSSSTSTLRSSNLGKRQTLLASKVMNSWRYQMSFNLPPEFKGTDGLREYFGNVISEMRVYCDQACILPWDSDDFNRKVTSAEDIPKSITQLKTYFFNARSMHNGGWGFTKIRIGLPAAHDRATFETDVQEWAKGQNIRLYEATVQHSHTKSCGWLSYAPKSLNKKKWANAVMKMYAKSFSTPGAAISLGIAWRALNGQKDVDQKQKAYAMHVEAPADMCTMVKRYLRILSRKKLWPLGVKFRLMPDFNQYMKESNKDKHRYMVNKHRAFHNQILEGSCHQIISLDRKITNANVTVREIVTQIRDNQDGRRFFGSIDEHWKNSLEHTATLRPDKHQKAYSFLKSLSTYVMYLYPEAELKGIFTMEAIDKATRESFNDGTQEFHTEEDADFLKVVQEDMDDDSLDFLEFDEDEIQSIRIDLESQFPKVIGGDKTLNFQGDDDTITAASIGTSSSKVSFTQTTCFPDEDSSVKQDQQPKEHSTKLVIDALGNQMKESMQMLNEVKATHSKNDSVAKSS